MSSLRQIEADLGKAMRWDRYRLRRRLRALKEAEAAGKLTDDRVIALAAELERSMTLRKDRQRGVPEIRYDENLPITGRRQEIAEAIQNHQVVIVSGETGSGKSTQLPKICLELGRGIEGLIGHTQPRRIAARSVSARVAEELGVPLGREVGYRIRFAEATSDQTYIKLMTDGILLAESQSDPFLDRYDTIIIDEAHERSLNIDFLIGLLKRLLPKRRDLKVIITSATIDSARFAEHFGTAAGPAPVIEVSGRTYPVEIRYRPVEPDEGTDEVDADRAVLDAVDEVASIDRGDILLFMPTERDIHEAAKFLREHQLPGDWSAGQTEILPLYARLSIREQQRVFQPHTHRRIVIATNVAESSLTVPGIRYVVDTGTARISRYSARTKTQRLPIEPVSQASADQRAGRCGRVAPGVCIRLFAEKDYQLRDEYTAPEIQRTNLASVILTTKAFKLGDIERFPFLDPPRSDAIRDGYKTLFELGALDENRELTEIGRQLSRLPVDPRIGRMILAAQEEGCLSEVLIIAAALEMQDPRERPLDRQEEADAQHARFADRDSDFMSFLKLWDFYHKLKKELSRNQVRKACRQNFLSFNRIREWADIHRELLELVQQAGLKPQERHDRYDPIHRAILTGLLSNLAYRKEAHEYSVAGGGKAHLWPGSGIFDTKPKWVMGAEVVETTRRYLRTCARVNPRWIEPAAKHLVKRYYNQVEWSRSNGSAMALEKVVLFGLTVISGRRVRYGPIDPLVSRQLLLQHGLVEGDIEPAPEFLTHNQKLLQETEKLQAKLRRHDLVLGEWARYDFYDRRVPADVYDAQRLFNWLRRAEHKEPELMRMSQADLVREPVDTAEDDYPERLAIEEMDLPLEYQFNPGAEDDGITLTVPLEALNQLDPQRLGWLVPGLLEQKVEALIRSLPKELRRPLVPAPDTAKKALAAIRFGEGDMLESLAVILSRLAGQPVPPSAFQEEKLPTILRMNVRVLDGEGKLLSQSRDVEELRRELGAEAARSVSSLEDPQWTRDGLTAWDFDELPVEVEIRRGPLVMKAYPMLLDRRESVSLRVADTPERATYQSYFGLRRLFYFAGRRSLETQAQWMPNYDKMLLFTNRIRGLNLRGQLAELIADRAFMADQPLPRSKAEFHEQLAAGQQRIGWAVQEVVALVMPLVEGFHQAELALEKTANPNWQYAVTDVRAQLDALVGPNFLSETPWDWLREYPRYFQAIRVRLENLSGNRLRDAQYSEELYYRWQAYLHRLQEHEATGVFDPELTHYRWMLEEYRVSLYAQKLGTGLSVSPKRLDRQWAKIRV
jgi:ATP-dependent helicase HrpA